MEAVRSVRYISTVSYTPYLPEPATRPIRLSRHVQGRRGRYVRLCLASERIRTPSGETKEDFTDHGFTIVYDHDLDQPIADGFYFTIGYPGMTGGQLMEELVYYGVSAISLSTTGSNQQGLRACTSFIKDHQYDLLDERLRLFEENHQA